MEGLPTWLGTVPGWITALMSSGAFGLWLRYLIQRRGQDGSRLSDLEDENRQLRKDFDEYRDKSIRDADRSHRECRDELESQLELIHGLRNQLAQMQMHELERAKEPAPATRERFAGPRPRRERVPR
jgi:hypothetical protein